ncbi:PIN domain-containing protein [Streptomyces phaeochromogenes]|uniref:PIN domain-containing protein n=1 Tax=Streptomyces phaeochromogenes TaxID=1923 RepID=UPI0022550889|nr:PIN domain-containing protein [Streptomyces phaeochromogenes]MCX5604914.1 PIN domain-containing protein [Streptomyces phaeochromogenes]
MSDYHIGTFTSGYEEFWRRPQNSIDDAIRSYSVVLDTNAILNLYRMNTSARDEYLHVLEKIASRIWIPRKVADEFHRNRLSSVDSHIRALEEKSKSVENAAETLRTALRDFARLRSLGGSVKAYVAPFNESISQITQVVKKEVKDFDLSPGKIISDDPILERLAVVFDGRVGDGVPPEKQKEVRTEAERRCTEKIPPGYKDAGKRGEDGGYGDYFIWWEVLDYAKRTNLPILFVSTDVKEDWIRIQCGLSVGPRPELVQEMHEIANVQYFHLSLAAFLTRAADVLEVQVSQETIDQVNQRSDEQRRLKRDLEKAFARARELDREIESTYGLLKEAEQRRLLADARLDGARSSATSADLQGVEKAAHMAEIEHFEEIWNDAISMESAAREKLHYLEVQRHETMNTFEVLKALAE